MREIERAQTKETTPRDTSRDSLEVYLAEVRRLPLLQAEEEHELAVRLAEDGDSDAARRLFLAHLRLVVKIAFEYRRGGRDVMDLVQEGNVGLLKAIRRFDPYRGVKLSTYAGWWIRAYILRFILCDLRLVKIGTTAAQRKLFFHLSREKARLSALGITPSAEAIGDRLAIEASVVEDMDWRLSAPDASLDAPLRGDDDPSTTRGDLIGANDPLADEELSKAELRARVREEMASFSLALGGRERCIFEERLLTEQPLTLQEIAERYGVSRERVRQIENRLLTRLRTHLLREMGEQLVFEIPGADPESGAAYS